MKLVTVPLDNRPVTSGYPQQIARLAGIDCLSPPQKLLASLNSPSCPETTFNWLEDALMKHEPNHAVLCIDSLLYGGLINSRYCPDEISTIKNRLKNLSRLKKIAGSRTNILAQTSIMRISDNYDNSEEKPYWSQYGRELFEWSTLLHRLLNGEKQLLTELDSLEARIPRAIRADYLRGRSRNFQINKALIQSVAKNSIDYLAVSLDDSGPYGLNIHERDRLASDRIHNAVTGRIAIYAGADEVSSTLMARALTLSLSGRPRAVISFNHPDVSQAGSLYEGQTIETSLSSQLSVANIEVVRKEDAEVDFQVLIHGAPGTQGDHIHLPGKADLTELDTRVDVESTLALLDSSTLPVILCDLAYANGADPLLAYALLERRHLLEKLWGYAGWNTSGNSIGSALATGVAAWYANRTGSQSYRRHLKECLFVRLADDWAYQSCVRKKLNGNPDQNLLTSLMDPLMKRLQDALDMDSYQPSLSFPWLRTFEVSIKI